MGADRATEDQAEYPTGETTKTRRQYLAPSLLWRPSAATSLTVLASFTRHKAGDDAAPVYLPVTEPTAAGDREGPYRLRSLGVCLQDQVRFADRWLLTLAGRHDKVRAEGESSYGPRRDHTDSGFTRRVGLTWLGPNGWAPYISHGTSFHPALGVYDSFENDLEKSNLQVTNPGTGESQQVGRVRARGLELEEKRVSGRGDTLSLK